MSDRFTEPTTDALAVAIDGLHAIENGVRLKLLEQIVAYDTREAWREDGACSMADWLTFRFGFARRTAAELVRVAHQVSALPAIKQVFGDGRVSWDKLVLVASVATPADDALWAEEATTHNVAQIEDWVRHRRRMMRTEAERALRERYVRMRWDDTDGSLLLNGRLPAADGAAVKKAIETIAEDAPRDPVDGTFLPHEWRCADALVELASGGAGIERSDRATVVVHVEARDLNRIHGIASLEAGPPITAESARRLACDSRLQVVADGPDGEPIGVGRTTRTVPAWLTREIRRRDGSCRFADCGKTRGLQSHHVHHWAHGGPTDLDNLVTLCRFHHRLVHDGGWRLLKDSRSRIRFVRPDGRPLSDKPTPFRPWVRERIFGGALAGADP